MDFENKNPEWSADGVEPSASLKQEGFKVGYKPPASYFNWFWTLVSRNIAEIKAKLAAITLKDVGESASKKAKFYGSATSEDGVAYTATIEGVTELYNGLEVTIIPNMRSKSRTTTLNLNGFGAKGIRQPLSFSTFVATAPDRDYFIYENVPVRLMYHESYTAGGIWLMADKQKTSAQDLYGAVPVANGGTGASDAATARANIGAAPSGYGYGEPMASIDASSTETYAEYCTKIDNILADMPSNTTKLISATPPYSEAPSFGACAALLYKGNNAYASLIPVGHSNIYAYGWRMQKRNGTWQPFEWENPPMTDGVEYRTTERFDGEPVYTKLFSCSIPAIGYTVTYDEVISVGKGEFVFVTDVSTGIIYRTWDGTQTSRVTNWRSLSDVSVKVFDYHYQEGGESRSLSLTVTNNCIGEDERPCYAGIILKYYRK